MFRVLVTGRNFGSQTPDFNYFLERGYEVVENPYKNLGRAPNEEELLAIIEDIDAILVGNDPVTARVIDKGTRLKVVAKSGVGVDNIDIDKCSERGIAVVNVPDTTSIPVAELAFGHILALSKLIMYNNRRAMNGLWPVDRGHDLYHKKLGIVGFGRIGQMLARRASGFEMDIYAYDPYMNEKVAKELEVMVATLDEITEQCDYISIHVPKLPSTVNLFDAERISRMKEGSYLINCARGGIVNEEALYDALQSGHLAGASADVLETEPPQERPKLYDCENFLVTTHIGGNSLECISATAKVAAENIIHVLEKQPCRNIVNAKALGL